MKKIKIKIKDEMDNKTIKDDWRQTGANNY